MQTIIKCVFPGISIAILAAAAFILMPDSVVAKTGEKDYYYKDRNMHLCPEGKWETGEDKWGKIVRVNMLKIQDEDWDKIPGVKKAWPMQGYEGVERMGYNPRTSEIKDVDGDGEPDIFRLRGEQAGSRIERLRYKDGSVVWESEPVGALHGDETRLAVFDLDGDGVASVIHSTSQGTWGINAETGETEWIAREAVGEVQVGHFLNRDEKAIVVRGGLGYAALLRGAEPAGEPGVVSCFDADGELAWKHDTGLRGDDAGGHEMLTYDANGDGLDEVFVNWNKLTLALRGDGSVPWEDRTQKHHSDALLCGDADGDGATELIYDHEGCGAAKGPLYIVNAMTGEIKSKIAYRKHGVNHAQNFVLGDFDKTRKGLEIAFCQKSRDLYLFSGNSGKSIWKIGGVPASLLSRGDWNGDGTDEILVFGPGVNVDGQFSVWNAKGKRLYAISFLPSPYKPKDMDDKHYKKHPTQWKASAAGGGHEGLSRQVDLDGNGRADVIMPFGQWHWGSHPIIFLMEGPTEAISVLKFP